MTTPHAGPIAGIAAGVVGLLIFLVLHALWIMPIWFILPLGLPLAGGGGLAAGWAYGELRGRLPGRPWRALAVAALVSATLAPAVALAELRPPLYAVTPSGAALAVPIWVVAACFVLELLATATLAGGLIGWRLGRTRRAALAMALAGFCFALGPGHNIPLIGGTTGVTKELAIMAAFILASALVLVEAEAWLTQTRSAP